MVCSLERKADCGSIVLSAFVRYAHVHDIELTTSLSNVLHGSQVKDSLKLMMGNVHAKVTAACQEYFEKFRRHVYVTPKSYLSFIAGYKALYDKKRSFVQQLATSSNAGLAKMNEAKLDVGKMKASAAKIATASQASRRSCST